MKKLTQITMMLLLVIAVMAGCSAGNQSADKKEKGANTPKSEFPVTIKDASGENVKIEKKPKKIVSLIPSNTEVAFALGLDKEIVGVSDFDNYPEAATKKPKIGGMDFNVEKIVGMKPDLVLAHASSAHTSKQGIDQLKNAGIKVVVINEAQNFQDTYKSINMIAKATGTQKQGDKIVKSMKDDLADIKEKAKQVKKEKKVWVEVAPAPEIYTAGKGTFIDDMLTAIHAKNAAGSLKGWSKVSEEQPVKYNPDVIVTTYGYYSKNPKEQILSRKGWKDIPAVKNKNIYDVHSDKVTRPGPRLIEGVEELAKAIYPDVYKK
ncbi:ABC transporter substrate-binding protein [Fictibacillus enclensis]|uniref:ABC transporter substrate-binding protein n=1 Tax=Fictibacillus enclensis TaxID=1017270 RepID=UPI003CD0DFCC